MLNLSTRWIDGDHFNANTEGLKERMGDFSLFLSTALGCKVQCIMPVKTVMKCLQIKLNTSMIA